MVGARVPVLSGAIGDERMWSKVLLARPERRSRRIRRAMPTIPRRRRPLVHLPRRVMARGGIAPYRVRLRASGGTGPAPGYRDAASVNGLMTMCGGDLPPMIDGDHSPQFGASAS